jgi:hypothetical protein
LGQKCSKGVMLGYHVAHCQKTATVTRDGRPYCGTHDPVKAKELAADRLDEIEFLDRQVSAYRDMMLQNEVYNDHIAAAETLCEGVDTEQLKALGKGWVKSVLDSIQKAGYFGY